VLLHVEDENDGAFNQPKCMPPVQPSDWPLWACGPTKTRKSTSMGVVPSEHCTSTVVLVPCTLPNDQVVGTHTARLQLAELSFRHTR
jgi:hypothetical protein